MDAWAYRHGIQLDFIRPGKPVENSFIESFNGRLRDEGLNVEVFCTLEDVREKLALGRWTTIASDRTVRFRIKPRPPLRRPG
jgi:putative transposase